MKKYLDLGCVFLMALCLTLLALGLATPVSARAQTPPPPGAPPPGGPEMGPPPEAALKDALALTDAQLASLKALQETRMQTVQALMPQIAGADKALADALKAASSDPAQLGTLLLAAYNLKEQARQADQAVVTGFKALLTADQTAKLTQYLAMKDSLPVLLALQRMGF